MPTREVAPERIARGTRPQPRQDSDVASGIGALDADDDLEAALGCDSVLETNAIVGVIDIDTTTPSRKQRKRSADDSFAATGAFDRFSLRGGEVCDRRTIDLERHPSMFVPPAPVRRSLPGVAPLASDDFATEGATTSLVEPAPLASRIPPPLPDFEAEVATTSLPDRARLGSPRQLVAAARRAASNGGVNAPEAFDDTRALSPRAAVQLARRTSGMFPAASEPPPVPARAKPVTPAVAQPVSKPTAQQGTAIARGPRSRPMPVATPRVDESFQSESATFAMLHEKDIAVIGSPEEDEVSGLLYLDDKPHRREGGEEMGPYILHERIGSGGMGSVHRAELRGIAGFRKSIAFKRMWPHLASDLHLVQSFIQEARLASALRHNNIVQAYDFGKLDGTYFIAMELVHGPTLGAAMKQAHRAAGAVPIGVAVDILIQLCEALEYAHGLCDDTGRSLGIIHRDVSPANMILSECGVVKLIDFGVAKATRSQVHTEAGVIKGKLAYVAPEYTEGQLDARADLWSVGVIAYELLTGQRLFIGDHDYETLRNVREKPIFAPSRLNPQIGRDLDDIVLTALSRDPEARWQSATALRNALVGVAQEMRLVLGGQAIREWVKWAFEQQPRRETGIVNILSALDSSNSALEANRAIAELIERPSTNSAQAKIDRMSRARSRRFDQGLIEPPPAAMGLGSEAPFDRNSASLRGAALPSEAGAFDPNELVEVPLYPAAHASSPHHAGMFVVANQMVPIAGHQTAHQAGAFVVEDFSRAGGAYATNDGAHHATGAGTEGFGRMTGNYAHVGNHVGAHVVNHAHVGNHVGVHVGNHAHVGNHVGNHAHVGNHTVDNHAHVGNHAANQAGAHIVAKHVAGLTAAREKVSPAAASVARKPAMTTSANVIVPAKPAGQQARHDDKRGKPARGDKQGKPARGDKQGTPARADKPGKPSRSDKHVDGAGQRGEARRAKPPTSRRELSHTPFAQSRVLARQQAKRSHAGVWLFLLLAAIATLVAVSIWQGWISESTIDSLAARADRFLSSFD